MIQAISEACFRIEDWHNFGPSYAKTLGAWIDNLQTIELPSFARRRWEFYLHACQARFIERKLELSQVLLSRQSFAGPQVNWARELPH